jgi:hypothetical protein
VEPTETITAGTVGFDEPDPIVIDDCVGCDGPINSGEGIVVDKTGKRWHPECRTVDLRKATTKRRQSGSA